MQGELEGTLRNMNAKDEELEKVTDIVDVDAYGDVYS